MPSLVRHEKPPYFLPSVLVSRVLYFVTLTPLNVSSPITVSSYVHCDESFPLHGPPPIGYSMYMCSDGMSIHITLLSYRNICTAPSPEPVSISVRSLVGVTKIFCFVVPSSFSIVASAEYSA